MEAGAGSPRLTLSMAVTALVSGGKDSIYAAYLAETQGWSVDELVTLRPEDPESMMFHTPNLDLVPLQAASWGKRHRSIPVHGRGEVAELDALEEALAHEVGPVVAGAIESSYQWARLLRVGGRVGRRVFTPLWRRDPARVVREEISAGLDIRLVHLAAESLSPELLGRPVDVRFLEELERTGRRGPRVNVAGEGGEYETLVVDAPFFRERIEIDQEDREITASTARLTIRKAHLVGKPDRAGGAHRP
ncbi:MAG: diphthine--ammonia ligase [Thermoplasmata archaeon]|nr:diphthine--ammonia ligase [Thermoplasmata archaeon]